MRKVALTGGIATGKSWVLRRIATRGIPVVDADRLAHEAIEAGTPGAARVVERFGAAILAPDGSIDRRALGRIVFADASARVDLEAIVHPAVYDRVARWYAALPPGPAAVADIPLLFETGRQADFDEVVVTACPPEEQVRRLRARDGLSEEEAQARLAAQWPIARKMASADTVIDTSGSHEATDAQVDALVARWSA